jgi:hypothetical protein
MKRRIFLIIFLIFNLFFVNTIFSQTLTVSSIQLNFGNAYENAPDSLQLTIYNNLGKTVTVTGIKFYSTYSAPAFSADNNYFAIADGGSSTVWVKFSPMHNIFHNSELVIDNNGLRGSVNVDLKGQGKYSNTYYDASENLSEENLKTALHNITGNGYISLTYSPARDAMFMIIDNKKVNGQGAAQNTIESVYTGIQASGYIDRADCQNNYSFNTEHTFPQSLFNGLEPMLSDLNHLFPTDDASNNERGDNPFGVVTNPNWSQGGSLSNGTTFEPRDQQKGAAARALFYFALRYSNYNNFLTSQESILRTWNKNFLPSSIDRKRNDDVNSFQFNRNPFIDYPQFADRITSISNFSATPVVSSIDLTQDTIIYGYVPLSVPNIFHYVIVNNGNADVHFTNFTLSHPGMLSFQSGGTDTLLSPGDALGLDINFFTVTPDSIHGWLNFSTDVPGHSQVSIPVFANDPLITGIQFLNEENMSLFPNPAHDEVTISMGNNMNNKYQISITDVYGRIIKISDTNVGNKISFDIHRFIPGAYFFRFENTKTGKAFFKRLFKF